MNRPPDMRQLLRQAQEMQSRLAAAQAELAEGHYEGSAGGGMVKAVVSGANRVVSITINPDVIDPSDPDMLGDLVMAAVNQAMLSASTDAEQRLGGLAGGLDLGGLLG
jgi:DNA-binding YbaB/EbfC family protein